MYYHGRGWTPACFCQCSPDRSSLEAQPVSTIIQDLRYAIRILIKNPGFSVIAIVSLALGMGANAAIFSLADALFLRPLPILEPSGVVNISTDTPQNLFSQGSNISYPNYARFSEEVAFV
jgi:hypothetical protein